MLWVGCECTFDCYILDSRLVQLWTIRRDFFPTVGPSGFAQTLFGCTSLLSSNFIHSNDSECLNPFFDKRLKRNIIFPSAFISQNYFFTCNFDRGSSSALLSSTKVPMKLAGNWKAGEVCMMAGESEHVGNNREHEPKENRNRCSIEQLNVPCWRLENVSTKFFSRS